VQVARVTNAGSAGPDHANRSGGPSRNGRQYVGQARHLQDISTDDPHPGGRQGTTEIYREISLDGDGISHQTLGQGLKKGSMKGRAASLKAGLLQERRALRNAGKPLVYIYEIQGFRP
jgi:hypothetical protein